MSVYVFVLSVLCVVVILNGVDGLCIICVLYCDGD